MRGARYSYVPAQLRGIGSPWAARWADMASSNCSGAWSAGRFGGEARGGGGHVDRHGGGRGVLVSALDGPEDRVVLVDRGERGSSSWTARSA